MTAREIIEEGQLMIGDPHGDFHNQKRMLFALNRALTRISVRSRSIHEQIYHPVVAGQYQYGLPLGTVYIRKAKYKLGTWFDLQRGHFTDVELRATYPGGGPPRAFSMWQNARLEKFVGEVTAISFDANAEPNRQRSVTFALSYTAGVIQVGDIVFNLSTKHAEGTITGVNRAGGSEDGQTEVFYTPLVGGDAAIFSLTNEIRVTSPHSVGHAVLIAPTPTVSDESGEESIALFVARRHREITVVDIENENDFLELDDEFDDVLMYEVLHWARIQRHGLDAAGQLYRRLSNDEYHGIIGKVENRIAQNLNMWESRVGSSDYRNVSVKAWPSFNDYRIG